MQSALRFASYRRVFGPNYLASYWSGQQALASYWLDEFDTRC